MPLNLRPIFAKLGVKRDGARLAKRQLLGRKLKKGDVTGRNRAGNVLQQLAVWCLRSASLAYARIYGVKILRSVMRNG